MSGGKERVIGWVSGGAASAVACKLAISKYGQDRVELVYIDTRSEHPDTDKQATSGAGLVANLASYCGGETQGCTDISPCCDCLKMANVFERGADPFGAYVAQLGDLLRPQQEPTT